MSARPFFLAFLTGLMFFTTGSASAMPGAIELRDGGKVMRESQAVQMSLNYNIAVGETISRAIAHGIKLTFIFEVEYRRDSGWPWQRSVESASQSRLLRYLPLSRQYEVHTAERPLERYDSLAGALAYLGSYEVITTGDEINHATLVRTRLSLDRSTLSIPLRNRAYLDRQWHLNSGWKEWPLAAE